MIFNFQDEQIKKGNEAIKNQRIVGGYGISYLDDFLIGIHPEDFILIGAETGYGKTELVNEIAYHNAEKIKVHLFSLEADSYEPFSRKMYKFLVQMFFDDSDRDRSIKISYRNYVYNLIDLSKYEPQALKELSKYKDRLFIHERGKDGFNVKTLTQKVGEIKDNCDLLIIDHIDYFDLDEPESENRQMTEIMKELRKMNQVYRMPIIAVSHLRKRFDRKQIFPGLNDFMGSSNKEKIAKTVILFGPDFETKPEDLMFPTFCKVVKSRVGGQDRMAARLWFNVKMHEYQKEYGLVVFDGLLTKAEDVANDELPEWAATAQGYWREKR